MLRTIKTWNGYNVNDGINFTSVGLNFGIPATATAEFVQMANADPVPAGVFSGEMRNLAISVHVLKSSLELYARTIFKRGTTGLLVVTYSDDGLDYQTECQVQSFVPDEAYPGYYVAILQAGESTWRAVVVSTLAWAVDASVPTSLAKTVTLPAATLGYEETRLVATVTPSGAAGGGWAYQYLYQLVNYPGYAYGRRAWCIALDTAALVTAGKLLATCFDLRIMVNGVEARRWISDPNTNHTHVWFNAQIGVGYSLTLLTPVASTGDVGELVFEKTATNLAALKALPASFILEAAGEWFQCQGIDQKNYKVGVVKRGALGTALAAHALHDVFAYIENVVYVLAGNAAATNPALDDANYDSDKPLFDLAASDNVSKVYTAATLFYDPAGPARPGTWISSLTKAGDVSEIYTHTQDGETGNPALGMKEGCWQKVGRWQNEQATLAWAFNEPGGIVEVSMTGSKRRSTDRWPATCALQRSADGKAWTTIWSETTPVSVSTWTAITHAAQAVTFGPKWIRFVLMGSLAALASALAYFEVLTCTVVANDDYLPVGTLLGQAGNFPLAIMLSNTTNGDAAQVVYPMLVGKSFLLDGENYVATYDSVNAQGAMALDDESRDVWIRLAPGANALTVAGDNLGTIGIGLSWYNRRP
jgi:hypothetical protein